MGASSSEVHPRVRAALAPFLKYRHDWIFHYPVYPNTFCFAYDLAALLSGSRAAQADPHTLGDNFRRHDGLSELPEFTYRHDIEIFVAVEEMIEEAKNKGHDINGSHSVCFTRYDMKWVFLRKSASAQSAAHKWLLITDLPRIARELVKAWKEPPAWIRRAAQCQKIEIDIRSSWERELHDLFANDPKIYLFGAPMAAFLKLQSNKKDPQARYIAGRAGLKPIPTFFVFRCNSGVDPMKVRGLRAAVAAYYRLIFRARRLHSFLHPRVAREYARLASTVGLQHPFNFIPTKAGATSMRTDAGLKLYAKILQRHHHPRLETHRSRIAP